ncbi:MAG: hypothetical protein U0441_22220 [Polyangiaceae bacterium]
MSRIFWLGVVATTLLTSCNYDDGECWSRSEDDGQVGAGGGPVVPVGGAFGDVAPTPQDANPPHPGCGTQAAQCTNGGVASLAGKDTIAYCAGTCAAKCPPGGVSGFSPSVFAFKTIVADDGKDLAGGWQAATGTLSYYRLTGFEAEEWKCTVTVGMPVRAQYYGVISASSAATMAAGIASVASFNLMHIKPELPQGIFCHRLGPEMQKLFTTTFLNLGATVK